VTPRCWFCDRELDPVEVLAEGVLEGRDALSGGPLYRYRCPRCKRESLCERNARGRLLAHPRAVVPIFDRLHAAFDADLQAEDAARRAWWAKNGGLIAWFHREFVEAIDAGTFAEPLEEPAPGEPRAARPPGPPPAPAPDPWAVLGVPPGAPRDEVVRAFRRLAREHHPDMQATADGPARARAERRFIEVVEAYEKLKEAVG
jgi:DnaJ-domain-containing protein 1